MTMLSFRNGLVACLVALVAFAAAPAKAQNYNWETMTPEERELFGEAVRSYLLENPEVIFEAIQILEQRRAVAAAQQDSEVVRSNADALFNDGYSFTMGNPDGDIVVVEFLDYRCGFCKRAHPEVLELLARDPNIRLVEKQFPILGPQSVAAARVAMAALKLDPSKYAELTDLLMEFRGNMTEQVALRIAGNLGYDIAALKRAAADPEIQAQIDKNYALARELGIQGTPSFVIGTEIIRGYLPVDDLQAAVRDARNATN